MYWIELENLSKWKEFGALDKQMINEIENTLQESGEYVISSRIQYLWSTYAGNEQELQDCFDGKKEYLQQLIVGYVKKNIKCFKES